MYIEMIDETGQVSEKLKKEQTGVARFCSTKTWQEDKNGGYIYQRT